MEEDMEMDIKVTLDMEVIRDMEIEEGMEMEDMVIVMVEVVEVDIRHSHKDIIEEVLVLMEVVEDLYNKVLVGII